METSAGIMMRRKGEDKREYFEQCDWFYPHLEIFLCIFDGRDM
jgi:hypothetical protein